MNFQPLFDKILVKRDEAGEQKTAGGLFLPDSAKTKPTTGIVVSVGAGKKDEPMVVKVDDKVLFGEYAGLEVDLEEGKFLLLSQAELLGVFR